MGLGVEKEDNCKSKISKSISNSNSLLFGTSLAFCNCTFLVVSYHRFSCRFTSTESISSSCNSEQVKMALLHLLLLHLYWRVRLLLLWMPPILPPFITHRACTDQMLLSTSMKVFCKAMFLPGSLFMLFLRQGRSRHLENMAVLMDSHKDREEENNGNTNRYVEEKLLNQMSVFLMNIL